MRLRLHGLKTWIPFKIDLILKLIVEETRPTSYNVYRCGALAQLGERKVRNLEARGSIPLRSTTRPVEIQRVYSFGGV